jgi:uncharacterized membrane protein YqjE
MTMAAGSIGKMAESEQVVALLKEAAQEVSELTRLEVELAKREMRGELLAMKRAAVLFAAAAGSGLVALSLVLALVACASSAAAIVIAVLAVAAGIGAGFAGFRRIPRPPLDRTRQRLEVEAKDLKAKIA